MSRYTCGCGLAVERRKSDVNRGRVKSCGCLKRELDRRPEKHGMCGTKEYGAWARMIGRCENPNDKGFKNYGKRGIKVCVKWRREFLAFLRDVGKSPSAERSIGRIDNDKGYEPGNVEWQTRTQQNNNRRSVMRLEYRGATYTLIGLARETKIPWTTLRRRIIELGMPVSDAVKFPSRYRYRDLAAWFLAKDFSGVKTAFQLREGVAVTDPKLFFGMLAEKVKAKPTTRSHGTEVLLDDLGNLKKIFG